MKKVYITILLTVFGAISLVNAQQYPYYYQYLMNKYMLSPAYAGLKACPEAFLGYRQSRLNVDYAPKTLMFNVNAPVGQKMGIGLNIINDKADIFSNLYILASYAYHLKLNENHFIDFAISGGLNQKNIDLSDVDDPYWTNGYLGNGNYYGPIFSDYSKIKKTSLELGGGLMYRWKKLNVGFVIPSFYESNKDIYAFVKHYMAYANYDFRLNDNWNLEPSFLLRAVEHSPINFDVSAFARYKEKIWFGPTFKRNMIGALSVGGEILKNVSFMYSYDFAVPFSEYKGVLGDNWGGHEISIGYRFCKHGLAPGEEDPMKKEIEKRARVGQVDSLKTLADQLNDRLKGLADSLNALKNKPATASPDDLKALRDEIAKLNNRLIKVTGVDEELARIAKTVYFDTDKYNLKDISKKKLDEVVEICKKYPSLNILIEGHTDNVDTDEYNQALSERRAKACVDYIITQGISYDRLTSKGYGESRPIDTNDTEAGRANNRRTEIKAY